MYLYVTITKKIKLERTSIDSTSQTKAPNFHPWIGVSGLWLFDLINRSIVKLDKSVAILILLVEMHLGCRGHAPLNVMPW